MGPKKKLQWHSCFPDLWFWGYSSTKHEGLLFFSQAPVSGWSNCSPPICMPGTILGALHVWSSGISTHKIICILVCYYTIGNYLVIQINIDHYAIDTFFLVMSKIQLPVSWHVMFIEHSNKVFISIVFVSHCTIRNWGLSLFILFLMWDTCDQTISTSYLLQNLLSLISKPPACMSPTPWFLIMLHEKSTSVCLSMLCSFCVNCFSSLTYRSIQKVAIIIFFQTSLLSVCWVVSYDHIVLQRSVSTSYHTQALL